MGGSGTTHTFEVAVSDVDRGVYAELSLVTARHPSETAEYLVARILAYALEYADGIAFSGGLFASDEPAVWIKDPTGALVAWIEVGTPDPARLHKASKAADRVVVYCHKDPDAWLRLAAGHKMYAPDRITIVPLDRALVAELARRLDRRTRLQISVTEGELYAEIGGQSFSASLPRVPWTKALDPR